MPRPKTLLEAIATIGGFYVPNSRAMRNCNPGNIEFRAWTKEYGAVLEPPAGDKSQRFAKFPTNIAGFNALRVLLLGGSYKDSTIEQAINRYAPPSENNTTNYVQMVCDMVGCQPTDKVWKVMVTA